MRERQFRRYVREAARRRDSVTGEELVRLLERRLDNVVYRLGLASTRAQARQFVSHGHVHVDGRRVDRASYSVRPGQVIALDAASPVRPLASTNTELTPSVAPWLQADFDSLSGTLLRLPERSEIPAPVDEHLIIELYSRL